MQKKFWNYFVVLAAFSILVAGLIYSAAQQVYRNLANDPQVEISREVAKLVAQGIDPEAIVGQQPQKPALGESLSAFLIIYDKDFKPMAGSVQLNGQVPTPPSGVLEKVKTKGESRLTWEPEKGKRAAIVVVKADNDKGFVLAGKSLMETESRIRSMGIIVAGGFLGLLALSALLAFLLSRFGGNMAVVEETNIILEEKE